MAADPTSPIAPARVFLLLLPIGRVTSLRFAGFVDRLRAHTTVRLGDITPDSSSASFSPLAFPNGIILYNITTALPLHSHVALSPFETFREPLVVIGVCDAVEYQAPKFSQLGREDVNSSLTNDLQDGMKRIRALCSHTLVARCLLFDYSTSDESPDLSRDVLVVSMPERPTTMKTIMADISSLFLTELSTLARTIQTTPPLDLLYNAVHGLSTTDFPVSERAAVPFRSSSLRVDNAVDNSVGGHAENSDFDSNEGSVSSSPALSSVTSLQNVQSTLGQDLAERPSLSTINAFSAIEEVEINATEFSDKRTVPNFLDRPTSQDLKKRNRNSGNASDFANSRLKARQAIIIGSLYLHAGRWPDAMRELVDGATRARVYTDHLWHGKALENILVTMLLLAWNGFEFQIPQICFTWSSKMSSVKRNTSVTSVGFGDIRPANDPQHNNALQNLCTIIPDLTQLIVNTYARAANVQGEVPFQFAFSESVIRLARLVSVLHLYGNELHIDALQHFVYDTPMFEIGRPKRAEYGGFKAQLTSFLLKGYPMKSSALGLSVTDNIILLSGIAFVFSLVDLRRYQALMNKQLLTLLIPELTHAKKVKLAKAGSRTQLEEIGHSKSSLIDTGVDNRSELESLQRLLCREYAVFDHVAHMLPRLSSSSSKDDESLQTSDCIINDFVWRSLGSREMKKNILRMCADISELMGDYQAAINYLAVLFFALRPGINASTGTISVRQRTSREEQLDLAAQMHRILESAAHRGLPAPTTAYWDPFLVCNIEVQEVSELERLFIHNMTDPLSEEHSIRQSGPFLHDASKTSVKNDIHDPVLVAGETAYFLVTLRNPFEFEVCIEKLALLTDGVVMEQKPLTIILGPFRKQRIQLSGIPLSTGALIIQGCKVQVRGCREQEFFIFPLPWQPLAEIKTKHCALGFSAVQEDYTPIFDPLLVGPTPKSISVVCNIAKPQPFLKISSTSLSQSTISILQGQVFQFTVTVKNLSRDVSVNFLHISFQYQVDSKVGMKDSRNPFVWKKRSSRQSTTILPGQCLTLDVEVYGILTMSHCALVVEYAHLEQPVHGVMENFFIRRALLPLTVTVNPSIDLFQSDAMSSKQSIVHELMSAMSDKEKGTVSKLEKVGNDDRDGILLLLDFRNSWLRPLSVSATAKSGNNICANAAEVIQPGHIGRLMVLIPKIPWQTFNDPGVIDNSNIRSTDGRVGFNMIRCREYIVKELRVLWQEIGQDIRGTVDLYHMKLSNCMVEMICGDPVEILTGFSGMDGRDISKAKSSRNMFIANLDERLGMNVEITNRTTSDFVVHVEIRIGLTVASAHDETDLSNRLTWSGTLHRRFVKLKSQSTNKQTVGLCFFSVGCYEITIEVMDASGARDHLGSLGTSLEGNWRSTSFTSMITVVDEL